MWPFNRGWSLNGGQLNRGSTGSFLCLKYRATNIFIARVKRMINYRLKPKRNKLKTTVEINEILVALPFVFHTYRIVLPHVKE
jgi:hypothetical protein